jgi:c-di-GMP-binding flagellar brake protein YcgR
MIPEMRESSRERTEIECKYIVKHGDREEEYAGIIDDISGKGLALLAEEEEGFKAGPKGGLKPGMIIHVSLADIKLKSKIIYIDTARVGVHFLEITPEQREALNKITK